MRFAIRLRPQIPRSASGPCPSGRGRRLLQRGPDAGLIAAAPEGAAGLHLLWWWRRGFPHPGSWAPGPAHSDRHLGPWGHRDAVPRPESL
eukprot:2527121-Prorocentrum_lima.AAC.1